MMSSTSEQLLSDLSLSLLSDDSKTLDSSGNPYIVLMEYSVADELWTMSMSMLVVASRYGQIGAQDACRQHDDLLICMKDRGK